MDLRRLQPRDLERPVTAALRPMTRAPVLVALHGGGRNLAAEHQLVGWAAAPLSEQSCDRPPALSAELARLTPVGLVERGSLAGGERLTAPTDRVGREARVRLDLGPVAR